jgi:hypothetical protein
MAFVAVVFPEPEDPMRKNSFFISLIITKINQKADFCLTLVSTGLERYKLRSTWLPQQESNRLGRTGLVWLRI